MMYMQTQEPVSRQRPTQGLSQDLDRASLFARRESFVKVRASRTQKKVECPPASASGFFLGAARAMSLKKDEPLLLSVRLFRISEGDGVSGGGEEAFLVLVLVLASADCERTPIRPLGTQSGMFN